MLVSPLQGAKQKLADITVEHGGGLVASGQRVDRSLDRVGHFVAATEVHSGWDSSLKFEATNRTAPHGTEPTMRNVRLGFEPPYPSVFKAQEVLYLE